MYTIKTLNAISPVGLAKLPANQFEIDNEAAAPQGILVRSADMHETPLPDSLLAIARAGAGTNNIPVEECTSAGIVVFNTPGANATPWQSWSLARWWRAAAIWSMLSTGRRPSRDATPSPRMWKRAKYLSA